MFQAREEDVYPARLAAAYAAFAAENDRPPEPGSERDELRWRVAEEILTEKADGHAPQAGDTAHYLATRGAEKRAAVAGYDLVFTPVKSVSTLWALADAGTREQIGRAHTAAWRTALEWVQSEAALTRVGAGGVGQIDTKGLVAAAFDHLDSRTGDPNLHTHVAVSTKVQGSDGQWRSLDGRVLHALGVAASERYNTLIEEELRTRLGVRFVEEGREGKRPVREIAGVDRDVRAAFSQRRNQVEENYRTLLAEYRTQHGREAPRAVQFKLAQQATLATRQDKEHAVGLAERLPQWRATAQRVLGERESVEQMVARALAGDLATLDPTQVEERSETADELAAQVLAGLGETRSTWNRWNLQAEAERVGAVLATSRPTGLGPVGAGAGRRGRRPGTGVLDRAHPGRAEPLGLAAHFACSGRRLSAGIGAAGTGKTTAMTAFACAVEAAGGRVIGLAPSAAAAAVLGAELEVPADTLHKLLDVHARAKAVAGPNGRVPDGAIEPRYALDARSVLLVDEAGMAGTPELAAVLELAERYGASIRLLGDPSQLAAVGSGGALRLIDHYVGAAHLEEVRRFLLADGKTTNEKEARASLQLRKGNPVGLDYYVENDRARGGTREAMIEDVYAAWATDMAAGDSAIMVAATNDVVVELNARARRDRVIAGRVKEDGVFLHDGGTAGVGDIVVSRRNDRRLRTGPSDFVKNGDLWRVTRHYHDGALSVVHRDTKASVTLPAGYVAEWIELGYAATVHRVQGMTVDAGHLLVDETMTRDHLYTGATRGRYMNRMYVVTDAVLDVDLHEQPDPARAVRQTLEQVLDRTEGDPAALEALVTEWDSAHSLAQLVPAYEDAHTRLLEPDREQRIATLLHEQIPAHADRILTDPAWPALLARLARHENSGSDLRQLLPNALAEREIGTADSLAQVLHWRIGDPEPEPGESNLPSWVTPAPQEDPEPTQDPAPQPQVEADPAEDETLADQKIPDVRVDPGEPAYREAVEINTAAWTWWNQQSDSSDSWTATYLNPDPPVWLAGRETRMPF